MHPFGSKVYVHIPMTGRKSKLSNCAKEDILVGHNNSSVNYRILDLNKRKVYQATNVIFTDNYKIDESKNIIPTGMIFSEDQDDKY